MKRSLLVFLAFQVSACLAQRTEVDSLLNLLGKTSADTSEVALLKDLSFAYGSVLPDSGIWYGEEALRKAQSVGYRKGEAQAHLAIGTNYRHQSDDAQAMEHYERSLAINEAIGNREGVSAACNNIGSVYSFQGDFAQAVKYYQRAIEIDEALGARKEAASTYGNIGTLYALQGDLDRAIEQYRAAVEVLRPLDEPGKVSALLNNIGYVLEAKNDYEGALEQYRQSLEIKERLGDEAGKATAYSNMGNIRYYQGDQLQALELYQKALDIYRKIDDRIGLAYVYNNMGNIYVDQEKVQDAFEAFEECLAIYRALEDREGEADVHYSMATLYHDVSEDYEKAVGYYARSLAAYRSLEMTEGAMSAHYGIGRSFTDLNRYDSAEWHLRQALDLALALEDVATEAGALSGLAENELRQGRPEVALPYARKSLTIAEQIGYQKLIQESSRRLYQAASAQGLYREAYEALFLNKQTADSLYNQEKATQIARLQAKYEYDQEKKQVEAERTQERLQQQAALKRRNLTIVGGSVLLALLALVALLVYRQSVQRKKANALLTKQKHEISEKNEELSQLNEEVQTQNERLDTEYRRSEGLLLNILPVSVASELKAVGKAAPRHYESVSILFTDFVGFTKIAERLTPDELVAQLDKIFAAFDDIMLSHGLEKIKTIGDAYMAASGLPEEREDHAEKAVAASLDMLAFIEKLNEGRALRWQMRVGVHSGPVTAGVVGKSKFAYDVWGDAVNLAARMEQSGEAGRVNVSEATAQLIEGKFETEYRGTIQAKNKGEVAMYFVGSQYSRASSEATHSR